jgi:hypothetical protein
MWSIRSCPAARSWRPQFNFLNRRSPQNDPAVGRHRLLLAD